VRAAVHTRFGPPDVVEVRDVPDPTPGDGELLVRVHTATVNRTDCHYRSARPLPMRALAGWTRPRASVLGNEFAGTVVGLGAGVQGVVVGDRVFGYCEGRFGAHAERLVVRAAGLVAAIPDGLATAAAAPATEGAHYALTHLRRAGVTAGSDVLVYGATGAIGSAAVPLAKQLGATVTAVCATAHLGLVTGLGADRVVDYTAGDFTDDAARYDVVLDAHGSVGYATARRLLRPGGRFASAGAGPHLENLYAPLTSRLGDSTRCVFTPPKLDQATVRWFAELLADGRFRPLVDRTYPLDEVVDAYRYVEGGQKLGNVLLAVDPS
jgi:NADPH:quinone reductase-like Zn-dependent oxidoreductase